ncbi:hypothetical protein FQV39_03360 [Bosea sp. F3-2]|uniref:hypothetical protein n=1 Tax=Bosea sp. F3-2 TaxID=2599640 RepID=UPI0011EFEBD5|nr:hypothetical protein [Bosea sp. F3-2]QEL21721.1 hypothetical protein FQV39_03360 [Bosea sp. F3-2]
MRAETLAFQTRVRTWAGSIPIDTPTMVALEVLNDVAGVTALPGMVTGIGTPTRGWQSVTNSAAAVIGQPVELDAQLRKRQTVSTALPSLTVFEGTIGAVASITGVDRLKGYENDTGTTDANGIPAHSISLVVQGGDATAIAQAIAAKKRLEPGRTARRASRSPTNTALLDRSTSTGRQPRRSKLP